MKSLWLIIIVLNAVQSTWGGFGYELIMTALETIQTSIKASEQDLRSVNTKVNKVMDVMSALETMQTNIKALEQDLRSVNTTVNQVMDMLLDESSCPKNAPSGIRQLRTSHNESFKVFCEDGWIVIHRRFDGSLSFNRNWNEYRNGFGYLSGEHWLGLERMHQITRGGSYELMVVLKNFDGVEKRAKFQGFEIASEAEQYRLNVEKFTVGDAGDSLTRHNKLKFSTPERDNDNDKINCAAKWYSGWWFDNCYDSNLNGIRKIGKDGLDWWTFDDSWEILKEARMMIRAMK